MYQKLLILMINIGNTASAACLNVRLNGFCIYLTFIRPITHALNVNF